MTEAASTPVRRGRRKSQRLNEIIEAGARLLYSDGFANTSVADVTRAVGITPSALYRHVSGKQKLLEVILDRRFLDYESALEECHGWDSVAETLTLIATTHRDLGVLWQREARYMPDSAYDSLASRLRAVAKRIASNIDDPSPRPAAIARAWATISVLTSLSYHEFTMVDGSLRALMRELILGVGADSPQWTRGLEWSGEKIAIASTRAIEDDGLDPTDRAILEAAARLYGTRGYHKVSMTELGQAVGMAGPSIYYRYNSKGTVLAAVLERANTRLFADASAVLGSATDTQTAMRDLLNSYARLVALEPHIVEALLSEILQLDDDERQPAADSRARYVKMWSCQLRKCYPHMTPTEAQVRVHAAMTIINDLSRTHSTRAELSVEELCGLAWSALVAGLSGRANGDTHCRQERTGHE
ncbi:MULTISPECIES: TetR/AcrR family transcriptional regulator [unclassified Streptomyces]|uniref:TetR/AcrR family transcriptional regulator n=1 Tax=unclassified Streptomyces TaxID=2593676 RepID=UPI00110F7605|nr:TetR/AcrR family transcriptional regulator [Streptomyces sp. DASNCL29]TMU98135.1 TetR/AcrR family transcriptional regulator [Streptomyces sp. DASNCL29]